MPELGPYGSVRGALSNERPYRDSGAPFNLDPFRTHGSLRKGTPEMIHFLRRPQISPD
jgi:hypothetical protein